MGTTTDPDFMQSFNTARFLNITMLITVAILAALLYWIFPHTISLPVAAVERSTLTIIEITFGALAIFSLVQGYLLPGRMVKRYLTLWANDALRRRYAGGPVKLILSSGTIRCGLFEGIALCGLILGLFGAGIAVTLPFMAVSAAALVTAFPRADNWRSRLDIITRSLSH
jgi:hypothetical protein